MSRLHCNQVWILATLLLCCPGSDAITCPATCTDTAEVCAQQSSSDTESCLCIQQFTGSSSSSCVVPSTCSDGGQGVCDALGQGACTIDGSRVTCAGADEDLSTVLIVVGCVVGALLLVVLFLLYVKVQAKKRRRPQYSGLARDDSSSSKLLKRNPLNDSASSNPPDVLGTISRRANPIALPDAKGEAWTERRQSVCIDNDMFNLELGVDSAQPRSEADEEALKALPGKLADMQRAVDKAMLLNFSLRNEKDEIAKRKSTRRSARASADETITFGFGEQGPSAHSSNRNSRASVVLDHDTSYSTENTRGDSLTRI